MPVPRSNPSATPHAPTSSDFARAVYLAAVTGQRDKYDVIMDAAASFGWDASAGKWAAHAACWSLLVDAIADECQSGASAAEGDSYEPWHDVVAVLLEGPLPQALWVASALDAATARQNNTPTVPELGCREWTNEDATNAWGSAADPDNDVTQRCRDTITLLLEFTAELDALDDLTATHGG